MQHPGGGQRAPQPGEAPPSGLFGQLRHEEIERMRRGQHGQQMRAPQLRRTQGVPPSAGGAARANFGQEVIGGVGTQQFEQPAGADGRQSQTHARTLTQTSVQTPPWYRRSPRQLNPLHKLSEHPLTESIQTHFSASTNRKPRKSWTQWHSTIGSS